MYKVEIPEYVAVEEIIKRAIVSRFWSRSRVKDYKDFGFGVTYDNPSSDVT